MTILENALEEKDKNINSLTDEINVLKNILDEKDKTINSLKN